ncbi:DNA-binding response regulator [Oceanobacillus oncorhynchi subsp. incaldanensis]|uniref:response regulator transcription factor n=1 Tax=Oceanobacillus oncorhynchi TaxID=545501 RepID=UPI001B0DA5A9|nr:response regulator transcription factor [Oceanobacillus oncorhynchi]GIO19352.1 DNA-binding response regulator [Oceanobacillus oncorhynchi subsp. incaldanensis]
MKNKILIVDDEWNMRNLIKIHLSKFDFDIEEAKTGEDALQKIDRTAFNIMILDIMLPDIDGWKVCEVVREKKNLPILMLTARDEIKDRVYGLNIGADDYLTKPFAPEELVARVIALIRRQKLVEKEINTSILNYKDLSIDLESRTAMVKENPIELTPKEFDILYLFASQPKRVFTREIILDKIWSTNEFRDMRAIDSHVKNLREKLRKSGLNQSPIKTVWGVGYKFFNTEEDRNSYE